MLLGAGTHDLNYNVPSISKMANYLFSHQPNGCGSPTVNDPSTYLSWGHSLYKSEKSQKGWCENKFIFILLMWVGFLKKTVPEAWGCIQLLTPFTRLIAQCEYCCNTKGKTCFPPTLPNACPPISCTTGNMHSAQALSCMGSGLHVRPIGPVSPSLLCRIYCFFPPSLTPGRGKCAHDKVKISHSYSSPI